MKVTEFALALPSEICAKLGTRFRARRLALNLTIETVSQRAGINELTLRKFEKTGNCRLETLVALLCAIDAVSELQPVLASVPRSISDMRAQAVAKIRKNAYRRKIAS